MKTRRDDKERIAGEHERSRNHGTKECHEVDGIASNVMRDRPGKIEDNMTRLGTTLHHEGVQTWMREMLLSARLSTNTFDNFGGVREQARRYPSGFEMGPPRNLEYRAASTRVRASTFARRPAREVPGDAHRYNPYLWRSRFSSAPKGQDFRSTLVKARPMFGSVGAGHKDPVACSTIGPHQTRALSQF